MRFVKPIDRELICELAGEHSLLVSVEENALIGGAGAEVARVLEEIGSPVRPACRLGFPTASSTTATRRCCWRNRPRPRRHRPRGTRTPTAPKTDVSPRAE
jgi:deoxyxylulose-5-phosphate synthase